MQIFKVLLIVLAGLFIFAPAFHGGWLWDDDQEISANGVLPDPHGLVRIWKGESGADYFPVKSTFQWLLFRVIPLGERGQIDSTGYHLVNVFLHIICALMVWRLMLRLGLPGAWLGGLLFAIHPIMVESVAWVSELKNTLSLPFLLLSMFAYIEFDRKEGEKGFDAALPAFLLAVLFYAIAGLTKTSVIMYPVTLLLYAWWRRGTIRVADVLYSAPFFLISAVLAGITVTFQWGRAIAKEGIPVAPLVNDDGSFSLGVFIAGLISRAEIAGVSILWYLYKAILPFGLLPIYPKWIPAPVQLLAWVVVFGLAALLWIKRNSWGRGFLFAYGFFLVTLFPIIGFIKMSYMRITWAADHLIYLPMLGLICLAAAMIGTWYSRSDTEWRKILLGFGVAAFALLVWQSHWYAGRFANEYEMWTYTLSKNPDAWQAHSRLGKVLLEMGRNDDAFYHISESVRLRPDLAETHNNYGAMLEKKGDIEGALAQLRKAAELQEDVPIYKVNLGSLLVRLNRYQEGKEVYEKLLAMDPKNPTFLCNYGVALYFLGENDKAIDAFQKALAINPNLKDAKDNLQTALKKRDGNTLAPSPAGGGLLGDPGQIKLFR